MTFSASCSGTNSRSIWKRFRHVLRRFHCRAHARSSAQKGSPNGCGERRILRVNDVSQDPRYIHCENGVAARSELVVPLLLCDRLIGVLDLESSELARSPWNTNACFLPLAPISPLRFENARLYQETRDTQLRLQQISRWLAKFREVCSRTAHAKSRLDLAAGYVPARELGATSTIFFRMVRPSRLRAW